MIRTPAHKQTDPAKAPGTCSFDRYPYMKHSTAKTPEVEQYLHQYIARKQAEAPKKLTFEEWAIQMKFMSGSDYHWMLAGCQQHIARDIWNAAQENK